MRLPALILGVFLPLAAFPHGDASWLGNWVAGEPGARRYYKVRITASTIAFAPGGKSDYFHLFPDKSKLWCKLNYKIQTSGHSNTYPNESAYSQDVARSNGRQYEVVLLELEHNKCSGFKYLQMAFPSDIENYADIIEFDDKMDRTGEFNYHRVKKSNRNN